MDHPVRFADPGLLMKRVTEALREAIVSGRLKPGERIRERELGESLGISRSPLREAIRTLESEGLITSVPHRGSWVTELTAADFAETNEARIMLETFAARLAFDRLDEAALAALDHSIAEARQADPNLRGAEDFEIALAFHDRLVSACGNSRIIQLYGVLRAHLLRYHYHAVTMLGRDHRAIEEHADLVAALRGHDLARFERLLTTHLRRATEELSLLFPAVPASRGLSRLRPPVPSPAASPRETSPPPPDNPPTRPTQNRRRS